MGTYTLASLYNAPSAKTTPKDKSSTSPEALAKQILDSYRKELNDAQRKSGEFNDLRKRIVDEIRKVAAQ